MRTQSAGHAPDERFGPAILLLKVLGPEEHAFPPDDAVGPTHGSFCLLTGHSPERMIAHDPIKDQHSLLIFRGATISGRIGILPTRR